MFDIRLNHQEAKEKSRMTYGTWTVKITRPDGSIARYGNWNTKREAMDMATKLDSVYRKDGYKHEVLNRKTGKVTLVG